MKEIRETWERTIFKRKQMLHIKSQGWLLRETKNRLFNKKKIIGYSII